MQSWSEGLRLAAAMKFRFPRFQPTPLSKLIKHASTEALDLISSLCLWDPRRRPTAVECLQHPYFQTGIRQMPKLKSASPKQRRSSESRRSSLIGMTPKVVSYALAQPAPIKNLQVEDHPPSKLPAPPFGPPVMRQERIGAMRRESSKELAPVLGRKISLRSHDSEEASLPPIQRALNNPVSTNRAAFKLVPLNYQKAPSFENRRRRSSRNSAYLSIANQGYSHV